MSSEDFDDDIHALNHYAKLFSLNNCFNMTHSYCLMKKDEFESFRMFYTNLLNTYEGYGKFSLDFDFKYNEEEQIGKIAYKGIKGKAWYGKSSKRELGDEFSNIMMKFATDRFFKNQVKTIYLKDEEEDSGKPQIVTYTKNDNWYNKEQKNNVNFYDVLRSSIALSTNDRRCIEKYEFASYDIETKVLTLIVTIDNYST